MEIVMSIFIGVIFGTAVCVMLSNSIVSVLFGILLLSHSVHLLLLTMAGLQTRAPPVISLEVENYTDPLPQAMILTAIVINFAITAFMFVLAYRIYQDHGTLDLQQLRGAKDE